MAQEEGRVECFHPPEAPVFHVLPKIGLGEVVWDHVHYQQLQQEVEIQVVLTITWFMYCLILLESCHDHQQYYAACENCLHNEPLFGLGLQTVDLTALLISVLLIW